MWKIKRKNACPLSQALEKNLREVEEHVKKGLQEKKRETEVAGRVVHLGPRIEEL